MLLLEEMYITFQPNVALKHSVYDRGFFYKAAIFYFCFLEHGATLPERTYNKTSKDQTVFNITTKRGVVSNLHSNTGRMSAVVLHFNSSSKLFE